MAVLPVRIMGRDGSVVVEVVGQDSSVVIEPKEVKGAIDPPLLALCKLREPRKRGRSFRKNHTLRRECLEKVGRTPSTSRKQFPGKRSPSICCCILPKAALPTGCLPTSTPFPSDIIIIQDGFKDKSAPREFPLQYSLMILCLVLRHCCPPSVPYVSPCALTGLALLGCPLAAVFTDRKALRTQCWMCGPLSTD